MCEPFSDVPLTLILDVQVAACGAADHIKEELVATHTAAEA
jgi:hypothetical protein